MYVCGWRVGRRSFRRVCWPRRRGFARGLARNLKPFFAVPLVVIGLHSFALQAVEEWEVAREYVTVGEKLGNGNFGDVFRGSYRPGGNGAEEAVAIKTLRLSAGTDAPSDKDREGFLGEAMIMKVSAGRPCGQALAEWTQCC